MHRTFIIVAGVHAGNVQRDDERKETQQAENELQHRRRRRRRRGLCDSLSFRVPEARRIFWQGRGRAVLVAAFAI